MVKVLTNDEKFLVDYIPRCSYGYTLYKYYETDEEDRGEIPDIWDKLHDLLDKARDMYDKIRLEYASKDAKEAVWFRRKVIGAQERVEMYEKLIDSLSESDADYFVYGFDNSLRSIVKKQRPVYKFYVSDGKIFLQDTGDTVNVWVIEPQIGGYFNYVIVSKQGSGVSIDDKKFRPEALYAFAQTDEPDVECMNKQGYWYVCSDCGSITLLNNGELSFYKQKGLQLPKRCESCRRKRKAQNAEHTNVF